MLTEVNLIPLIQVLDPVLKSVSIIKTRLFQDDGVECARSSNAWTFYKGQLDEVKQFIGVDSSPEITYLESLWS